MRQEGTMRRMTEPQEPSIPSLEEESGAMCAPSN
jgi:hypothetical protein